MSTDEGLPAVRLVPTLSDADVAGDLKRRLVEALASVLTICDEADAKGFTLGFSSGKGPLGKHVITQLIVAKHF
jgi:hypothetical protein